MQQQEPICDLSQMDDRSIGSFLSEYSIGLTVGEAKRLQFEILGRPATLAELILFGIEGSEHCSYKSSRPYLKLFETEGEDVILGAKEDAGVIRVATDQQGRGYAIVMSHESHNHPSQVVPYEGAATGVGGNVRDVCCMGAEVIAQADDLRFGPLSNPKNKWIYEGVIGGIAGYGNPIGVPTIAGGVQFDQGYDANCLVTVVSLGVLADDQIIHSYAPEEADGYDIILVGKPTDNSGFGGASFASFELEEEKREQNKGAVQEPNAFLGRHMIKSSVELFARLKELDLLDRVGFKDLGAGGIACASVELADTSGYGANIDIRKVHTASGDFPDHVILCAETQERYMWVCPPEVSPMILEHYNQRFALPLISRGARASVIGKITKCTDYVVTSGETVLVHAPASEVTKGFLYHREVGPKRPVPTPTELEKSSTACSEMLIQLLSHENIASRAPIYETYDKQVQGRTWCESGRGDAGIITPFNTSSYPQEIRDIAVTLTTDQNPSYNIIDPYQGAVNAVVEGFCNTVAVGAQPIALSDCLCYGNPEKPEQMRQFVDGVTAVAQTARTLGLPVIAGNVSLYNESGQGSIPPSPMIAVLGKAEDVKSCLGMDVTKPGVELLLAGKRKDECAGSIYASIAGLAGSDIPRPDLNEVVRTAGLICEASKRGLIHACHDISEGGVAVALSEMTFEHSIGIDAAGLDTSGLRPDIFYFSQSFGFIIAVEPLNREQLCELFDSGDIPLHYLGVATDEYRIRIGRDIDIDGTAAKEAYENGLRRNLL